MFQADTSLTFNNAAQVMAAGSRAIAEGETAFDFSAVATVDSSAVAILLAWQREARSVSKALSFAHVPTNLASLIALYDTSQLLGVSPSVISSDQTRSDLPHH